MARRRKTITHSIQPAWMITMTDLMTLLMTFFVVLSSLAIFDERSKHFVLESINSAFNATQEDIQYKPANEHTPGGLTEEFQSQGFHSERDENMAKLGKLIMGDNPEVRLNQNSQKIILSINCDFLFEPGSFFISAQGREILDKLAPHLMKMEYPMVIAGHSAPGQEEAGLSPALDAGLGQKAWGISQERSLAVYRHFADIGVPLPMLKMESFGDSRPRFSNDSQDGRRNNRRVDIILDKRNRLFAGAVDGGQDNEKESYYFKDFHFDLGLPDSGISQDSLELNAPVNSSGTYNQASDLLSKYGDSK